MHVFGAGVEFTLFMCSRLIFGTCVAVLWRISSGWSQEAAPANPTHLTPSWETQRQAATYALAIPAPRGQITDQKRSASGSNPGQLQSERRFPDPV